MTPHMPHRAPPTRATLPRRALLRLLGGGVAAGALPPTLTPFVANARAQDAPPMAVAKSLGPAIPPELTAFAADWPAPQQSLAALRAAASSITRANVGELAEAWRVPLTAVGGYGAVTAIPLIAGDVIYLQDMASNVLAIDREDGEVRWQTTYDSFTAGPNGVAFGYGRLFGALGATPEVFALDAATGAELWRTQLSANPAEFIFMQPPSTTASSTSARRHPPTSAARAASSSRSRRKTAMSSGSGTPPWTTCGGRRG